MRLRDELELSVLAEFGPVIAEAAGEAFQHVFDTLLVLLGFEPDMFEEFDAQVDQAIYGPLEEL